MAMSDIRLLTVSSMDFTVHGPPVGKARARVTRMEPS